VLQITVAFDETTTLEDVDKLFKVFNGGKPVSNHSIGAKICVLDSEIGS
jgi:hypothetical protein